MTKRSAPTNAIAKERLRAVLESDRGHLSGKSLELFKRDIATVMLSYMEIREEEMDVRFERQDDGMTLLRIEVPAVKVRKLPGELGG